MNTPCDHDGVGNVVRLHPKVGAAVTQQVGLGGAVSRPRLSSGSLDEFSPIWSIPVALRTRAMQTGVDDDGIGKIWNGELVATIIFPESLSPPRMSMRPIIVWATADTGHGRAAHNAFLTDELWCTWRDTAGLVGGEAHLRIPANAFLHEETRVMHGVHVMRTWAQLCSTDAPDWGYTETMSPFGAMERVACGRYGGREAGHQLLGSVNVHIDGCGSLNNRPAWVSLSIPACQVP